TGLTSDGGDAGPGPWQIARSLLPDESGERLRQNARVSEVRRRGRRWRRGAVVALLLVVFAATTGGAVFALGRSHDSSPSADPRSPATALVSAWKAGDYRA